jgi:hypothetical protein
MEILVHGKAGGGSVGTPLANKVMEENLGIIQRQYPVSAAEGMLADAYLVELVGPYLDNLNDGKGATPAELQGLQRVARMALEDHILKAPQRGDLEPGWDVWYSPLRRMMEDHWGKVMGTAVNRGASCPWGIPANDQELGVAVESLVQPTARSLFLMGVAFMNLLGSVSVVMRGSGQAPGQPLRLMKMRAVGRILGGYSRKNGNHTKNKK